LAAAAFGGWLASSAGLPLGWLLGAAFVAGAVALSGVTVVAPKSLSNAGLVVIGAAVGLSVTPDVASHLAVWAPAMVAAAALGVALAALATRLLASWARIDPATAFFALLPGGVFEMATIAEKHGGDRLTIAVLHALRVGMIVLAFPLLLTALDAYGDAPSVALATPPDAAGFGLLIAVAAAAGWLANRLGLAAGWLIGPMLAAAALSVGEAPVGGVPSAALIAAQIVVGVALGARFKRESLRAIPRAAGIGALVLFGIGAALAGAAFIVSLSFDEPFGTLALCFATGGMAEMVLTAKALSQNAALVAAFHAVRALLVNAFAGALWRRLSPRLQA